MVEICESKKLMEGNSEKNLKKTSKVKICGIGVLSPLPPLVAFLPH